MTTNRKIILVVAAFAALLAVAVVVKLIAFPGYERVGGPGTSHWGGRYNYVKWPVDEGSKLWGQWKTTVVMDSYGRRLRRESLGPFDLKIVGHDGTVYRDSGDMLSIARTSDGRRYIWMTFSDFDRGGVLGSDGEEYDTVTRGHLREGPRSKDGRPFDCRRPRRIRLIIADRYLFKWSRDKEAETRR